MDIRRQNLTFLLIRELTFQTTIFCMAYFASLCLQRLGSLGLCHLFKMYLLLLEVMSNWHCYYSFMTTSWNTRVQPAGRVYCGLSVSCKLPPPSPFGTSQLLEWNISLGPEGQNIAKYFFLNNKT